ELAARPGPRDGRDACGGSNLQFGREYIMPRPVATRLLGLSADAVAKAASESGVATLPYPKHYPLTSVDDVFKG
ncbi:malate dehydrogenase, partial [Pseudomonas syringae]